MPPRHMQGVGDLPRLAAVPVEIICMVGHAEDVRPAALIGAPLAADDHPGPSLERLPDGIAPTCAVRAPRCFAALV